MPPWHRRVSANLPDPEMFERETLPFEMEEGTPTITMVIAGEEYLLPWHAFVSATFKGDQIMIEFQESKFVIEGSNLSVLWQRLQTQEVKRLAVTKNSATACRIESIAVL